MAIQRFEIFKETDSFKTFDCITGWNLHTLEEVNCSNNNITNIVMWNVGELVKFDCSNNDLMTLHIRDVKLPFCFTFSSVNLLL